MSFCVDSAEEFYTPLGLTNTQNFPSLLLQIEIIRSTDKHDSYYFDLVDMLRRLLLTGGLIVLGDSSNVQIFLGGMVCVCWLCLVVWKRPYTAYWDNALSALSFQLLIIILSGMALEIYRLTPSYAQDPYQRSAFGLFMVVASVLVIASSFFIIFISVPCVRNFVFAKCVERCLGEGAKVLLTKGC